MRHGVGWLAAWPGVARAQAPVVQDTAGIPASLLPHDLSPWGLVAGADPVVKGVMALLLGATRSARVGLRALRNAPDLAGAARVVPAARECGGLVAAAGAEQAASAGLRPASGVKERVSWRLDRALVEAGRRAGAGTGLLATVGSVSPFVGLFGTVWGIMRSFIGISQTQTTNLAVVAPGIAEALLATAAGLVAAIPAVVLYNLFVRGVAGYRTVLGDAGAEVMRLLSRDLDRQAPDGVG